MPTELWDLYATICSQCEPENPLQLWMNYKAYMIEDCVRTLSIDDAARRVLSDVQCILHQLGKQLYMNAYICINN